MSVCGADVRSKEVTFGNVLMAVLLRLAQALWIAAMTCIVLIWIEYEAGE